MGLREQLEMLGVPVPPGMTDEELAAGLDMVSSPAPAVDAGGGPPMDNLDGAPAQDIDVDPQAGMRYGVPVEELTPQEARSLERYKVNRAKQLAEDAGIPMEDAYQSLDNSAAFGGVNISSDGRFNIDDQKLTRQAAFGRAEEEQRRQAAVDARGANMGAGMTRGQSDFFMTQMTPEQREQFKQNLVSSQRDRDMAARMQNEAAIREHQENMAAGQAAFLGEQAGLDRDFRATHEIPHEQKKSRIDARGNRDLGATAAQTKADADIQISETQAKTARKGQKQETKRQEALLGAEGDQTTAQRLAGEQSDKEYQRDKNDRIAQIQDPNERKRLELENGPNYDGVYDSEIDMTVAMINGNPDRYLVVDENGNRTVGPQLAQDLQDSRNYTPEKAGRLSSAASQRMMQKKPRGGFANPFRNLSPMTAPSSGFGTLF